MPTLQQTTKKYVEDHTKICCICGKPFVGYGNNPYPVTDKGRCCDYCNETVVVPRRITDWVINKSVDK